MSSVRICGGDHISMIQYLQGKGISSKVTGLTGKCTDVAMELGLPYITEVEGNCNN